MSILLVYLNRTIPQVEIEAVSEFLFHLLMGEVDKLPSEAVVHRFWTQFPNQHKQTSRYLICLRKYRLTEVNCYRFIKSYCGFRFGQRAPERLEQCRRLLANEANVTTVRVDPSIVRLFADYSSCFRSYRGRVDSNCVHLLRQTITSRRLRATKVVRATMNSMRPLLRALPTLKVIHLVRDPRAVALSRVKFDASGRGTSTLSIKKSGSSVVEEASLYCRHVIADIRSRLELEREFPGRIWSVRYEEVVANPEQIFRDIYKFLDEPMPRVTYDEMQKKAREGQTMNLTTKWQNSMKYKEGITIARHCAEFFSLLHISSTET